MSSEFRCSILFLPGSLNRVSISMAYMAHHTLWRMRIRTQCIHIQSVHYDFWQWLRATFSLLAVGITVNFIATMCCCYVTAVVVVVVLVQKKNQTNPLLFGKKSCVWDEAHNNGLPSTVYNVTMHGNYYSITPSGDMMWFSVLSLGFFYCLFCVSFSFDPMISSNGNMIIWWKISRNIFSAKPYAVWSNINVVTQNRK